MLRYLIKKHLCLFLIKSSFERNAPPRHCDTKKLRSTSNKQELLRYLCLCNLDAVPIKHKQQIATLES